jgi:hypothetical protein
MKSQSSSIYITERQKMPRTSDKKMEGTVSIHVTGTGQDAL